MEALQKLFAEALCESDFATSVHGKRKLESLLTYATIVPSSSSLSPTSTQPATGPSSSSAAESAAAVDFTSPQHHEQLIGMLKNKEIFGTIPADDDDDDLSTKKKKKENDKNLTSPTEATKLVLRIINNIFTDKRLVNEMAKQSSGLLTSSPPQILLAFVDVIASDWLCAEDVGVGSAAANTLVSLLMFVAKVNYCSASPSPSSSSTAEEGDENTNNNNDKAAFLSIRDAWLKSFILQIDASITAQKTVKSAASSSSSSSSMRFLDALALIYNNDVANKELELGNQIGLPSSNSNASSASSKKQGANANASSTSPSPFQIMSANDLKTEFGQTAAAVVARTRQSLSIVMTAVGRCSRVLFADVALRAAKGMLRIVGCDDDDAANNTDDDDDEIDPLMLINYINAIGPLGGFIDVANGEGGVSDTLTPEADDNASTSMDKNKDLSSMVAIMNITRNALSTLLEAFVVFLRRCFVSSSSAISSLSSPSSSSSSASPPLVAVIGGCGVDIEVDMFLGIVTPFILRGVGTLVRNNAHMLGALLLLRAASPSLKGVTSTSTSSSLSSCGSVFVDALLWASNKTFTSSSSSAALCANLFSTAITRSSGGGSELNEILEAFMDFLASVFTQKSDVLTTLRALQQQGDDNNKKEQQGEKSEEDEREQLDNALDALCSLFTTVSMKEAKKEEEDLSSPSSSTSPSSSSLFLTDMVLTQILYPSKPVSAQLKSSTLLLIASVLGSPLMGRRRRKREEGLQQEDDDAAVNINNNTTDDNMTFMTHAIFNNSIFSHKSSFDDVTRRSCWVALAAMLQHQSNTVKAIAGPSVAAHLCSLATADFAEVNLEVRRIQLYCCDLILRLVERGGGGTVQHKEEEEEGKDENGGGFPLLSRQLAPFADKLRLERKSGIYSKPQAGMMQHAPNVGTSYAY